MHGIIETEVFERQARRLGVSEDEIQAIYAAIAEDPMQGAVIQGTGGARKLRFRRPGTGKSGGYRTIHYYADEDVPVFMLAIYTKAEQDNISDAGKNELRRILGTIADDYRASVEKRVVKLRP